METGEIKILARRINEAEENIKTNYENLSKAKIEIEQLNIQYAGNEMTNAYYNVEDRVKKFFRKMNIEEQRDELIKIIRECIVFDDFLVIDTGMILFVFDTKIKFKFDMSILNLLSNVGSIYKDYFFQETNTKETSIETLKKEVDEKTYKKIVELRIKIQTINGIYVRNHKLKGKKGKYFLKDTKAFFKDMNIKYDFVEHSNVIFFIDVKNRY